MLIDVHILQNHAPSNLNRDDTGAPKDAIFGGVPRARISSQCLKRSIRRSEMFRDAFGDTSLLGERTQLFPQLLKEQLDQMDLPPTIVQEIVARAPEFGRESKRNPVAEDQEVQGAVESGDKTAQLIFLTQAEVTALAEKLAALHSQMGSKAFSKMKIEDLTSRLGPSVPRSVDIAMFGRMTTSAAFEDVSAAVQVAHAISTHRVTEEFDYYTAVDDISGESGAGFIGDTEFNSATYYKYLSIHWEGLVRNLADDEAVARRSVQALITAAAMAQPTGKQNSFAAHNLPDLVLVEARARNLPINYANAFLKPVRSSGGESIMDASMSALSGYITRTANTYGLAGERAYITMSDQRIADASHLRSLPDLMEWVATGIGQVVT